LTNIQHSWGHAKESHAGRTELQEIARYAPGMLKVFDFLVPQRQNSKTFNARGALRMAEEPLER
jgi:hypothetical protein